MIEKGYVILSEAWYGPANKIDGIKDEVTFGNYDTDSGTIGEMSVKWRQLGNESVPRLVVFDDAWKTLWEFRGVIEALSKVDSQNISPQEFGTLLQAQGFKDRTPRKHPYKSEELQRCHCCGQVIGGE